MSTLQSPSDWLWGLGGGGMTVRYSQLGPASELSGRLTWVPSAEERLAHVRLESSATRADLAGRFMLAQRVAWGEARPDGLVIKGAVTQPLTVRVNLCEQWLLYVRNCRGMDVSWPSAQASEVRWNTPWPERPAAKADDVAIVQPPRWFTLSVLTPGATLALHNVSIWAAGQALPVRNPSFQEGLTAWWPIAQGYFTPWHVDNMHLELLVERGGVSLALWWLMCGASLWGGRQADSAMTPWVLSVFGMALLGLLISVFEFPRLAFLSQLQLACTLLLGGVSRRPSS